MAAKRVLVPIGNGSEDIESVTLVDVLRRAGAEVTLASVESGLEVTFARKVKVLADALIGDLSGQTFDLVALPVSGGSGGIGRAVCLTGRYLSRPPCIDLCSTLYWPVTPEA